MVYCKCDGCGKEEPARVYQEPAIKPMWVEPMKWLRRFDKDGNVIALTCCYECDKKVEKGVRRKPGT